MTSINTWKHFKSHLIYLLPVIFSGLFFWKLDGASFWFDELVTIRTVLHVNTWSFLLNFMSDQMHPPLYFVFLKVYFELLSFLNLLNQFLILVVWANLKILMDVFSHFQFNSIDYAELYNAHSSINILQKLETYNEFTIRLPSAMFMTAANVLVFDYFKKKNLLLLGIVTCFLIGTNTKLIYYAQEARPYALFVLTFILLLREFSRVYSQVLTIKNFKKLVIINIFLLTTHFYGVFVVGAEILLLTWMNRMNKKAVLSSMALAGAFTLMFGVLYGYLQIDKFSFLRKVEFSDLLVLHRNALGYFVRWPFLYYLAIALAIKKYFKKFEESDRIFFGGAVFLVAFLFLIVVFASVWPIYNERYLVLIIPLQIFTITTIYYSISEALLIFVKNVALKNIGLALVFIMVNIPQLISQPYFHFRIFDYYESEKYYPLRSAYEAIVSDPDYKANSAYVLEEYNGSNFSYYEKKYKVEQLANLNPDESNAKKENRLKAIVENKKPQIFFLIRIRHKEIKQEEENFKIPGYSKKRLFLRQNTEAYKFTKAS